MTPLREKRRYEILKSALEVFSKDGYYKGTIEEIATLSNIGKATVYEYFTSKKNIFEEMILQVLNNYVDDAEKNIAKETTVRGKVKSLLLFNMDFLAKNAEIIERVFFGFDHVTDDFNPIIVQFHDKLHNFFIDLVEEGMESGEINKDLDKPLLALFIINSVYGLSSSTKICTFQNLIDPDKVIEMIFNGIS